MAILPPPATPRATRAGTRALTPPARALQGAPGRSQGAPRASGQAASYLAALGIEPGTAVSFVILPAVKRKPKPPRHRGLTHTTVTAGRVDLAKIKGTTRKRRSKGQEVVADAMATIEALDALLKS